MEMVGLSCFGALPATFGDIQWVRPQGDPHTWLGGQGMYPAVWVDVESTPFLVFACIWVPKSAVMVHFRDVHPRPIRA